MTEPTVRIIAVDPERIGRWVVGFAERHGPVRVDASAVVRPANVRLLASDGAVADFAAWPGDTTDDGAGLAAGPDGTQAAVDLVAEVVQPPARLAVALLRRGGYAVGLTDGPTLTRHHCGTRYVQSRTAAGGWSQQRFARRRTNQADALVEAVAERLRLVLEAQADGAAVPAGLVVGGDKGLTAQLLDLFAEDPVTRSLPDLPRRALHDIPDPRLEVLRTALRRGRAARVRLTEPEQEQPTPR